MRLSKNGKVKPRLQWWGLQGGFGAGTLLLAGLGLRDRDEDSGAEGGRAGKDGRHGLYHKGVSGEATLIK
jgi:hypothetical protein